MVYAEMNLSLITWNIQGIGGSQFHKRKNVLAAEIQRCTEAIVPDVIMVQEHHLDGDKIDKIGNICPGSWTNTWSAATGDRQTHGGVLIAMKAKYNASFTGRGCLVEGRAVYIRIKHRYGHLGN